MHTTHNNNKALVLCFSGIDPSGGAGIQADIESLAAHNCHCLPLVTLNSIQDSQNVYKIIATDCKILEEQFNCLSADIHRAGNHIAAIKIGMLGNVKQIDLLAHIISDLKNIPIILDPIFASGLGTETATQQHIDACVKKLLPLCTIATPNSKEALQIARIINPTLKENASVIELSEAILSTGLNNLLITGTHSDTENSEIEHLLFTQTEHFTFKVPRLNNEYHGSGCTLASALAANLAHKHSVKEATQAALDFTQHTLEQAQRFGCHQYFPNRQTKQ